MFFVIILLIFIRWLGSQSFCHLVYQKGFLVYQKVVFVYQNANQSIKKMKVVNHVLSIKINFQSIILLFSQSKWYFIVSHFIRATSKNLSSVAYLRFFKFKLLSTDDIKLAQMRQVAKISALQLLWSRLCAWHTFRSTAAATHDRRKMFFRSNIVFQV